MNGALAFSRPSKEWIGVSAVESSASSLTAVMGLALRVFSTRHIVGLSTSSARLRLSKIANKIFLQLWTNLSQMPPKCGAPGGANFQIIIFCAKSLSILASSHSFMNNFSLFAAPTKIEMCSVVTDDGTWVATSCDEFCHCS